MTTLNATENDGLAGLARQLALETVSVRAAAYLLDLRPDSVRARVRRGTLPAQRIGREVRIPVVAPKRPA